MKPLTRTVLALGAVAFLVGAAVPTLAQDGGAGRSRDRSGQTGGERPGRENDGGMRGAKVGEKAPDFQLTDVNGKTHKLSDYAGKIVVLDWINPGCPVCKRVMTSGLVRNAVEETKKASPDVVWLAINSTHFMEPKDTAGYLAENQMTELVGLIDQNGRAGHMYGARTTPHIFVIDEQGILRYSGAFDDDPNGDKAKAGEEVTNYAVNAIKQIKSGETVSPSQTRPYGCSVKYAPRGEGDGKPSRGEGRGGRGGAGGSGRGGEGGTGGGGIGNSGGSSR